MSDRPPISSLPPPLPPRPWLRDSQNLSVNRSSSPASGRHSMDSITYSDAFGEELGPHTPTPGFDSARSGSHLIQGVYDGIIDDPYPATSDSQQIQNSKINDDNHEESRLPTGDNGGSSGLPDYRTATENGRAGHIAGTERFGRWRGWVEKRSRERNLGFGSDSEDGGVGGGRGLRRGKQVVRPPSYFPDESSLPLPTSTPITTTNPSPSSSSPFISSATNLHPTSLAYQSLGSRFLAHSATQINCILPILQDRFLLFGTDGGLSVMCTVPALLGVGLGSNEISGTYGNSGNSGLGLGLNGAEVKEVIVGERWLQMELMEDQSSLGSNAEDSPSSSSSKGWVIALIATKADNNGLIDDTSEEVREIRVYQLSSLTSLARWTVMQPEARSLQARTLVKDSHKRAGGGKRGSMLGGGGSAGTTDSDKQKRKEDKKRAKDRDKDKDKDKGKLKAKTKPPKKDFNTSAQGKHTSTSSGFSLRGLLSRTTTPDSIQVRNSHTVWEDGSSGDEGGAGGDGRSQVESGVGGERQSEDRGTSASGGDGTGTASGTNPSHSGGSGDSWDMIVEDLPHRWATDYIILTTSGEGKGLEREDKETIRWIKLEPSPSSKSQTNYQVSSSSSSSSTGDRRLAVITGEEIQIYKIDRLNMEFRVQQLLDLPSKPRHVSFIPLGISSDHFRSSIRGTLPGLFVSFGSRACVIRIDNKQVQEILLPTTVENDSGDGTGTGTGDGEGESSLTEVIDQLTEKLKRQSKRLSGQGRPKTESSTKIRAVAEVQVIVDGREVELLGFTRGKMTYLYKGPLTLPLNRSHLLSQVSWQRSPNKVIIRPGPPSEITTNTATLQLIAFGPEEVLQIQELPINSLFPFNNTSLSTSRSKSTSTSAAQSGLAQESMIQKAKAELALGYDPQFGCWGGKWHQVDPFSEGRVRQGGGYTRPFVTLNPGDIEATEDEGDSISISASSEEGRLRKAREDRVGFYGVVRKGARDWRIFWMGDGFLERLAGMEEGKRRKKFEFLFVLWLFI